jgi:hypothetical protein
LISKYGEINNRTASLCLKDYINKVFKILPMREENCKTLNVYIPSLLREMIGNHSLMIGSPAEKDFLSLVGTLENLANKDISYEDLRSDVFKSISILKKMEEEVGDKFYGSK